MGWHKESLNPKSALKNLDLITIKIRNLSFERRPTNSRDEKVTNLFIDEPGPFINNYKFIKGFEGGSLDFYSISKNKKTISNS